MRIIFSVLLCVACLNLAYAQDHLNLGRRDLAVDGYDLVSYRQSGPIEGNPQYSVEHNGALYRFSSEANLEEFQSAPQDYLPEYGGYCAYAMLEGDEVKVDPESYKLINGNLYLYYKGIWGDTREKWNELTTEQEEPSLVSTANQQWQRLIESD